MLKPQEKITICEFVDYTFLEDNFIGFISESPFTFIDYTSEYDVIKKTIKPYFNDFDESARSKNPLYILYDMLIADGMENTESAFEDVRNELFLILAYGVMDTSEKTGWV